MPFYNKHPNRVIVEQKQSHHTFFMLYVSKQATLQDILYSTFGDADFLPACSQYILVQFHKHVM